MINKLYQLYFLAERKIIPGFSIKKDDLVLDIGSGNKPFWRSDVFLDSLEFDNRQRIDGQDTIHNIGHFVDADASNMPFKNKSFDFSYCSHLLEHVKNPSKVIHEIQRVSKSGYIEVPNGILESIKPFHSHLWFVYLDHGTLVFVRKSNKMHKLLTKNGEKYHDVINSIRDPFIRYYWKDKIKFRIIDIKEPKFNVKESDQQEEFTETSMTPYMVLVIILRKLFYRNKHIDIENLVSKK